MHPFPTVIHIEDNRADVILLKIALQECSLFPDYQTFDNGLVALDALRKIQKQPQLLVLDINLPGMSGHELLKAIKSEPVLRSIPVVILSTTACANEAEKS